MDWTEVFLVPRLSSVVDYHVFIYESAGAGQAERVATESTMLPGPFLGHVLDSQSNRLCDLAEDIPDVMGLQALRPSAAVCKVMTVPNMRCVRVVTPDEHVNTGFHEILIHDMAQEDWTVNS